jgi:DNA-binding SARP family transcriptional activator
VPEQIVDRSAFEVEIAVLGPVVVRGSVARFSRASALDLVVYLALHPAGTSNDRWATALWPDRLMAPATLHSTASAARRALGSSASGADHLPRSHGRLRLAPSVGTDWDQFVRLARSADPSDWDDALALVRGRPFDGLRAAEWTVLEGVAAEVEDRVAEVAARVADRLVAAGRPRDASSAARRGLLASPYDERLYRRLLVCADQEGHPAGVERIMEELITQVSPAPPERRVGAFDLAAVHPKTASLYATLTRRRRGGSGALATRK